MPHPETPKSCGDDVHVSCQFCILSKAIERVQNTLDEKWRCQVQAQLTDINRKLEILLAAQAGGMTPEDVKAATAELTKQADRLNAVSAPRSGTGS